MTRETPILAVATAGVDHRKLAEAQRAAAQALRDRQSQACAGTPEAARYPLASAAVVAAELIRESLSRNVARPGRGNPPTTLSGVKLRVHTSLLPEVFASHLPCPAAHVRASGDDGTDPTVVPGARLKVHREEPTLLIVDVRADDETGTEEALRRAQHLAAR